ncbi:MAG: carbamoyltransferase HypF [Mobilicoccus sp.]|nr:carbamoyltransferase HypF [Mobilicoccus sp.]
MSEIRRAITIVGVVQGVGFRPFVAGLAARLELTGHVGNDATAVFVEVQGPTERVVAFEQALTAEKPPLAHILDVASREVPVVAGEGEFVIVASREATGGRTLVPPDVAVCDSCLAEFADPRDRRHRHPFITCTDCGPRASIIRDLPYDRPATTMADFALCERCAVEYRDPTDRRYHAQPISCHDCGPRLTWRAGEATLHGGGRDADARVLAAAADVLRGGGIVAVKGIGGYHLACDATDDAAVARLRERKRRPDRPLAVMTPDLASATRFGRIEAPAGEALCSAARPIVLVPVAEEAPLAASVAPGLEEVGLLLPYAPLHHLLFAALADAGVVALVMTSGNAAGAPLVFEDDDALARLTSVADGLLFHDRPIAVPMEDSVVAALGGDVAPVRRSRGYAPLPLPLGRTGRPDEPVVLAVGAELKNTCALLRDGLAFVSAHLGDQETLAAQRAHDRGLAQLLTLHDARPALIACDAHPGYATRAKAHRLAQEWDVPTLDVQHHHAHLASLAAEHAMLDTDLVGIVADGTGYGCDGTIWGGEVLRLSQGGARAERLGHLAPLPLPGGDGAVRHPVRLAAAALTHAGVEAARLRVLLPDLADAEATAVPAMVASGTQVAPTSSAGRVFDVVAALLGVRSRITYEAQAAIELEVLARRAGPRGAGAGEGGLPLPVEEGVARTEVLLRSLVERFDGRPGTALPDGERAWLARAFHRALAEAFVSIAAPAADGGVVGLSGGVALNRIVTADVGDLLNQRGLRLLSHRQVPANDGGLSLGQLAVARATLTAAGHRVWRP